MGRTLVTGATGFVGSGVVRALLERGDDVRVTVRRTSRKDALRGLDVQEVVADNTDPAAVRKALRGVDRVFHVAGLTSMRAGEERLHQANVAATRTVLGESLRAGVERVVYTSSVATIGPGRGRRVATEGTPFRDTGLPYQRSKRAAEDVALDLAEQGLPVVIVNPSHVLGPGDHLRSSTDVVRRVLLRRIPAYVDGAINVVDIEDVARGHLLADERGKVGRRYILADRNYTWERLFSDIGRVSGIEPPAIKVPRAVALATTRLGEYAPGKPLVTRNEIVGASQYWVYRSTRARKELGFTTRPHEETVERTVRWYLEREHERLRRSGRRQPAALRLAGFGLRQIARVAP